jgi:hypothetical protein
MSKVTTLTQHLYLEAAACSSLGTEAYASLRYVIPAPVPCPNRHVLTHVRVQCGSRSHPALARAERSRDNDRWGGVR